MAQEQKITITWQDIPSVVGEAVRFVRNALQNRLEPHPSQGEARAIAGLMFLDLKEWSATDLIIHADNELSDYMRDRIAGMLNRLLRHEPIQYITGRARFYGLDFKVSPDTLVPRQETEELVELIIEQNHQADLRVLDIGTGSGAIAIALARNLKFADVSAIDISEGALQVAETNARALKCHIRFERADIFDYTPASESCDIIVSNPPYITQSEAKEMEPNVLLYEPHDALFVPDEDPLLFYRRIAEVGREALVEGGRLYFEINPLFSAEMVEMLRTMKYREVRVYRDISRRERMISCIK